MRSLIGYSYSCLMAPIPEPLASEIRGYGLSIPDDRIYDDEDGELGREDEPHTTVKYGLHTTDPDEIREALKDQPPFKITLGATSVFYNDEYVVMKLNVHGGGIRDLNRFVCDNLEYTDKFRDYNPHCTIAYVKKDESDPYWFNEYWTDEFEGKTAEISELIFSVPSGKKYTIELTGSPVSSEEQTMKNAARQLLVVARAVLGEDQYKSLNDAVAVTSNPSYEKGNSGIWYMKKSFFRDGSMGVDWLIERDMLPNMRTIDDTHEHLGGIRERNLERVWRLMQGEAWSPRGEARSLITKKGLGHTSMSVGDVIQQGSKLFMVDRTGFRRID